MITISDRGTGMSKEFMFKRYVSAGFSTKSNTNVYIGSFGIGRLSPFSYLKQINETQYNLETVVNGIKYYYVIYKKDEIPNVNLLFEEETDEPNGTSVSFSVPNNYHLKKFEEAIINQLRFFDGIQLEGFNVSLSPFIKRKNYCIDLNNYSYYSPYCVVGKNIYKIDTTKFQLMGEGRILLYFDVGDVDLVENREELKYTQKTSDALVSKFNIVRNELQALYDEQNLEIDSILEWIEKRTSTAAYVSIENERFNLTHQFKIIHRVVLKDFDNKIFAGYKRLSEFLDLFYDVKQTRGTNTITLDNLVHIEQEKGFSTYKLNHNNKRAIVLLENRINRHSSNPVLFTKDNLEELERFEKKFREEIKQKTISSSDLKNLPTRGKTNTLYSTKETFKYYTHNNWGKKISSLLTLKELEENRWKYLVFTDEKEFENNYSWYKFNDNKRRKTRIYISPKEYKKITVNNIKHILYDDFVKTKEFTNACVRGYILSQTLTTFGWLTLKDKKVLSLRFKSLLELESELKNIKKNLLIITSYKGNVRNMEHPLMEMYKEYEKLKEENEGEISLMRKCPQLYHKLILTEKKLKTCQSKLLKLGII